MRKRYVNWRMRRAIRKAIRLVNFEREIHTINCTRYHIECDECQKYARQYSRLTAALAEFKK